MKISSNVSHEIGGAENSLPHLITSDITQGTQKAVLTKGALFDAPWGQFPKANQAQEMRNHNIRTPRVFKSLYEGLDWLEREGAGKGNTIYFRSEHPDDGKINARSGILDSLKISYPKLIQNNTPVFYISGMGQYNSRSDLEKFCKKWIKTQAQKCDQAGYDSIKLGYTTWEGINGDNYTVVIDKSIPGTYFIHPINVGDTKNYARRIAYNTATSTDRKLIEFYEEVRQTKKFGLSPIIEIQLQFIPGQHPGEWIEGSPFFLQSLMTYPGEPSEWKLTREKESGEIEVLFVRGATPPGGIHSDLAIIPPGQYGIEEDEKKTNGFILDAYGETSQFSMNKLQPLVEAITSQDGQKILIICVDKEQIRNRGEGTFLETIISHSGISAIHKPYISIIVDSSVFYSYTNINSTFLFNENGEKKDGPITITVQILSDGKRAFLKIIRT